MLNYTVAGIEKRLVCSFQIKNLYKINFPRRRSRACSKANIRQDLRRGSRAPSRGDIFQVEDETKVRFPDFAWITIIDQ